MTDAKRTLDTVVALGTSGSSWLFPRPHQGLDVKCLREQIEQMHFRDFVAVARGGDLLRLPRRIGQDRHITSERGRIARKINNFPRVDLGEVLCRLSAESRPWRIQNHQLRPFL